MFRFFRQIRKTMIENPSKGRTGNKIRTYTLYALGEILLVVAGILIALQVNNWNEERNREQEAIQVLKDLKVSIEAYIGADYYLIPMIQLDTVHYHIFNKSLQSDLLDNSPVYEAYNLIQHPMEVSRAGGLGWMYNENVNTILENERLFPERFSEILFMVRRLNAAFQTMEILGSELQEMQKENMKYLSTKDWMYLLDEQSVEKRITFFHNDTYFRNRLRRFNELHGRFINQFDIWNKYSLLAWLEFQRVVEEKSFDELIESLESYGYERAREVSCNDEVKKDPIHSFYYWNAVFNNTDEPVELYFFDSNTGEHIVYKTLAPGELNRRFTNRDFPYLQAGSNGSCEKQYETGWKSFIVIDP